MMGYIKCPECGYDECEEKLSNSIEFKTIKCSKCGFNKEYKKVWEEIKNEFLFDVYIKDVYIGEVLESKKENFLTEYFRNREETDEELQNIKFVVKTRKE